VPLEYAKTARRQLKHTAKNTYAQKGKPWNHAGNRPPPLPEPSADGGVKASTTSTGPEF
jgi:hypothetical protein